MNAHTPRRLAADQPALLSSAVSPAAALCPVAALGLTFTQLEDRGRDLAEADQPADARAQKREDQLASQIVQASDMISARVEWTQAQSLEGIYFQTLHLRSLVRDLAEGEGDAIDRDQLFARFERLNALILEGLERLGRFDGSLYGKAHKTVAACEFAEVLNLLAS